MLKFVVPAILGFGLVLGSTAGANAQTVTGVTAGPSVASLPPSQPLPGPRASSSSYIPTDAQQITALGPKPGQGWYGYDTQTADDKE